MADKLFYSMGEVAEMFDVNQSLIRYWESKFDVLRPKKNKKGNRMFRPEDIENFKIIYHLVKERGMTLDGAKRAMKLRGREKVSGDAELMERLQSIRSLLVEVREILKDGNDDSAEYSAENDDMSSGVAPEPAADYSASEPEDGDARPAERKSAVTVIEPKQFDAAAYGDEERPNVPFYEQTLF